MPPPCPAADFRLNADMAGKNPASLVSIHSLGYQAMDQTIGIVEFMYSASWFKLPDLRKRFRAVPVVRQGFAPHGVGLLA